MAENPLDPRLLTGLSLDEVRLQEVAASFQEIRREIERLRSLDLGETHPAVVFRPIQSGGRE